MKTQSNSNASSSCPATTCSPFWYGIGAFFVAPVAAIFCVLMGAMMILAWPFIPFLCYMQKKEKIDKANAKGHRPDDTRFPWLTEIPMTDEQCAIWDKVVNPTENDQGDSQSPDQ